MLTYSKSELETRRSNAVRTPLLRFLNAALFSMQLTLGLAIASAPNAHAQAAPANDVAIAEARRLFQEGVALSSQELWADALERFRRSQKLVPRANTAFNIASILLRLGRPSEAIAAFAEYERLADPAAERDRLSESKRLTAEAESQLGRITLRVAPADAVVRVDGVDFAVRGSERTLTLDPGKHFVELRALGYRARELHVSVLQGSFEDREVTLERLPPARARDERRSVFSSPWFWVATGVAVAGAVVAGAFALSPHEKQAEPSGGTAGVVLQGLVIR